MQGFKETECGFGVRFADLWVKRGSWVKHATFAIGSGLTGAVQAVRNRIKGKAAAQAPLDGVLRHGVVRSKILNQGKAAALDGVSGMAESRRPNRAGPGGVAAEAVEAVKAAQLQTRWPT